VQVLVNLSRSPQSVPEPCGPRLPKGPVALTGNFRGFAKKFVRICGGRTNFWSDPSFCSKSNKRPGPNASTTEPLQHRQVAPDRHHLGHPLDENDSPSADRAHHHAGFGTQCARCKPQRLGDPVAKWFPQSWSTPRGEEAGFGAGRVPQHPGSDETLPKRLRQSSRPPTRTAVNPTRAIARMLKQGNEVERAARPVQQRKRAGGEPRSAEPRR